MAQLLTRNDLENPICMYIYSATKETCSLVHNTHLRSTLLWLLPGLWIPTTTVFSGPVLCSLYKTLCLCDLKSMQQICVPAVANSKVQSPAGAQCACCNLRYSISGSTQTC